MGHSIEEINRLLPVNGDTTLEVLAKLAREAVEAGLVEHGMLHRPSKGSGVYNMLLAFGAERYKSSADTLIFNESTFLSFYRWLSQAGLPYIALSLQEEHLQL